MRFYIYFLLCIIINNNALEGKNNVGFKNHNENNIELDDDLTLEKETLMILPASNNIDQEIMSKILSIISTQATSLGRFKIVDRNDLEKILKEQKLQLSGMVNQNQIIEIGELASAENALIIDIINFGQKGVPIKKEKEEKNDNDDNETLFTWIVKTVITKTIEKRDTSRIRLELKNNIHTELRATVKIINIETGISEKSFDINANYTGGNRDASLGNVLKIITSQIRIKLKELYMITSEVIDVNGLYINMLNGRNLGLKEGAMFEIASKNKIKSYKGKTITLPGKSRGLVKIVNVGVDGSKAKIVRKWRKIKDGNKAYELKSDPLTTDLNFTMKNNIRYEMSGKMWLNSFNEFSGSLNYHLGSIKDSKNKMDGYIGFGTDLKYGLFSAFGTNGYISLNIPLLFTWRGDDAGHTVMSMFSDPSIDANLAIQISKKRDIVMSASYVFTSLHGPWQWQRDTGSDDENGNNITETEWAVWSDGEKPNFYPKGFYFSISLRKIRF